MLRIGIYRLGWESGAPGKIRTPDPLIRSQVLYPAELPVPSMPVYLAVYLNVCFKDLPTTWQEVNI